MGLHPAFAPSSLPTVSAETGLKSAPLQQVVNSKRCRRVVIAHEGPGHVGARFNCRRE